MSNHNIDFSLPEVIKDFVFDLYQSSRQSQRPEEVQPLYDVKFRELSEKYFSQSPWPQPEAISRECYDDEVFLLFYREMVLRHRFSRMKQIPLSLYLEAWENYNRLFNVLLSTKMNFIALSTQWAYDIIQEFIYQFQSFCQFRSQLNRSEEDLHVMEANKDAWSLPVVSVILSNVIRVSQEVAKPPTVNSEAVSTHALFGYFSSILSARLECLLADYTSSLEAIQDIRLWDQSELFTLVPTCHISLFYHAGVSMLMMRRYSDCIETFNAVTLQILKVQKPGSTNSKNAQVQHSKILDKILSLLAIAVSLCAGHRVDDQVMELMQSKLGEKLNRLNSGDVSTFEELFENACPKFISPAVSDSTSSGKALDAWNAQVAIFMTEVRQRVNLFKLKSYLRLYSSIELNKMASFNEISEEELVEQLLSSRHKNCEVIQSPCSSEASNASSSSVPVPVTDVRYHIEDGNVVIAEDRKSNRNLTEKFFISGIRKNAEITADINRVFAKFGI